jgi:hypothetical protein
MNKVGEASKPFITAPSHNQAPPGASDQEDEPRLNGTSGREPRGPDDEEDDDPLFNDSAVPEPAGKDDEEYDWLFNGDLNAHDKVTNISIELNVDDEIARLIPPLSVEELYLLEENLRAHGCRDAIVACRLGGGLLLLDGHHRLPICRAQGIPYRVEIVDLPDREAIEQWVLQHQLGRRNLSEEAYAYLRGKLYNSVKRPGARTDLTSGQNVRKLTARGLAATYGVNEKTIRRDAAFALQLDQIAQVHGAELKQEILTKKLKIPRKDLPTLLKQDEEKQAEILAALRQGERLSDHLPPPARGKSAATLEPAASAAGAEGDDKKRPTAAPPAELTTTTRPVSTSGEPVLEFNESTAIWMLKEIARFLCDRKPGELTPGIVDSMYAGNSEVARALDVHRALAPAAVSKEGRHA